MSDDTFDMRRPSRGQNARTGDDCVLKVVGAPQKPMCANVFLKLHVHYDGVIELPDGRIYAAWHITNCEVLSRALQFRKSTKNSSARFRSRVHASTHSVAATKTRSRSRSPDIRPLTRALRVSQGAISLLLIFAASRDPAGGLLSNAMGVKRK
jgi:hypothetical protein